MRVMTLFYVYILVDSFLFPYFDGTFDDKNSKFNDIDFFQKKTLIIFN